MSQRANELVASGLAEGDLLVLVSVSPRTAPPEIDHIPTDTAAKLLVSGPEVAEDDAALIIYISGTTGRPKGGPVRRWSGHQAVAGIAVVGRPHEIQGGTVVAVVTAKENQQPMLDELREPGHDRIANGKLPRELVIAEIPR